MTNGSPCVRAVCPEYHLVTKCFVFRCSWFANTIGIGLCAVKIWFYYQLPGHFLIAFTVMLTFLYFPIR